MITNVSVVVTSTGRPELLRTLASVFGQTVLVDQVVVVDDSGAGRVESTLADAPWRNDPRLVVVAGRGKGANAARNTGINTSSGDVVALSDDDDYWFPKKLERQLAVLASADRPALVSCRAWSEEMERVLPGRLYRPGGSIEDYLFARTFRTPRINGFFQTSGLLASREVFEQVRFDEDLPAHQDWDFVIRVVRAGFPIETVAEVQYIYAQGASGRRTSVNTLEAEQQWALRVLEPRSRALTGYFCTVAVPRAYDREDWHAMRRAVSRLLRRGRPSLSMPLIGCIYILERMRNRGARSRLAPPTS